MKLGKMIQTLKILTRLFAKPEFFYQIVWELHDLSPLIGLKKIIKSITND